MSKMRFVGLDVHADTIAVAVADTDARAAIAASSASSSVSVCSSSRSTLRLPDGSDPATDTDRAG